MAKDELAFNKWAGAILGSLLFATSTKMIAEAIYAPDHAAHAGTETAASEGKAHGGETVDMAALLAKASVKDGKKYAKKCMSCHTFEKGGKNKIGPNLYGILGRKVAAVPKFAYSKALKNDKGVWDYEHLDCFLKSPKKCIKGNKMSFGGISDPQQRANVIAYLRSLSAKPAPLPTASSRPVAGKKRSSSAPAKASRKGAAAQQTATEAKMVTLLARGDVKSGKKVAKKCKSCHTFEKGGKNKTGPNLYGVVGRKMGTAKGFTKYSAALLNKGGVWDYEALDHFLAKPKDYIKKTKMSFAGIKSAEKRADLILFMRQQSDKPAPLPKK